MPVPSLPELIIGGLAVWRVSALISYERGPFALFQRIRAAVGIDHFDDGSPDPASVHGELAQLLHCVWCVSLWIGIGWYVGFDLASQPVLLASSILALSSLAILVERVNHG